MQISSSAGSAGLTSYLQLLAARNGKKSSGMGQGGGMDEAGAGAEVLAASGVNPAQNGQQNSVQAASQAAAASFNVTAGSANGNVPANQPPPAISSVEESSRSAGEDDRQSYTQGKGYEASAEYLLGMLAKGSVYQNAETVATSASTGSGGGNNFAADRSMFNEVLKSYSDAGRANSFNFSDLMQRNLAAAYGT